MAKWNIEAITGYKPITTFWEDFSIAEKYGINEIKDTYERIFKGWKENYKYLTELVMVLNHKIWQWYGKSDTYGRLYNDLWQQTDTYAIENLKGEELSYYYQITD